MATTVEKLSRAYRWRVRTGPYASTEFDGWNGHFLVPLDGEVWHVILSDGMGWRHLSIDNWQRKMLPSWNIMCRVKDLFFGDDSWAVQFHPARDDCVNDHPFVLHLWEPLNETLPHPPVILV
jgi:hypothetical protein